MGSQWKSAAKPALLALLFLLAAAEAGRTQQVDFAKIAPGPKSAAWWLRVEFHPFGKEIRGIPIAKIRPTWCKATEFRNDLFPPEATPDLTRGDGLAFSIDGSFDGARIRQTALIGVYESCTGTRGSFLLALANPPGKRPTVRFVHEMPDEQFGMLRAPDFDDCGVSLPGMRSRHEVQVGQIRRRFVQRPPDKK